MKFNHINSVLTGLCLLGCLGTAQASSFAISPLMVNSLAFNGSDITGTKFGQGLAAVNEEANPMSFEDLKGKIVVVFFGYTQCPDVCPTALAELAELMTKFTPEEAQQVQVIMVSIDPERDTPTTLKEYLAAFDPTFKGMTGSLAQIQAIADSFKAYFKKTAYTSGAYSMEHSSGVYVLDKQGRSRIIFKPGTTVEEMQSDIKELLAQ